MEETPSSKKEISARAKESAKKKVLMQEKNEAVQKNAHNFSAKIGAKSKKFHKEKHKQNIKGSRTLIIKSIDGKKEIGSDKRNA